MSDMFPAISGGVVTERHAMICQEQGHATHVVDGKVSSFCPRCGVKRLLDATKTAAVQILVIVVEAAIGRLMREDRQLAYLDTHSVPLADRPRTPVERRQHGIARVFGTWMRLEETDPEAVARDIESLMPLGRSERWHSAIRTWAHIARTDPGLFAQHSTYANYAALPK